MTPQLVKKNNDVLRSHTKNSLARVGLFRRKGKLRVKGGL